MSRTLRRAIQALVAALSGALAIQSAAHAEDVTIRIGYPSGISAEVPIVMEKAGIAAKHQLAAKFTGFQYGPPMMEGLASDQLDAVVTSFIPPFTLTSKAPGSVKFVATLGQSTYALLVAKGSTAKAISDLKGRKIGVSFNSESHLDLLIALKDKGIDAKSGVQLVNLQPGELPAAREKGLVDAVVIRQPQVLRLQESLGAKIIQSWPFRFTTVVRTKFLANHPDAVKNYIEALKDTVIFIATNSDQASKWFGEVQRIDPSVVKRVADENPLYAVKRHEDIKIEVDDDFKKLLDERLAAATSQGFVKSKVEASDLLP
jgi:ABC-type nitrate/sulfonate/bicarbonate transport system substrate-binding protein